MGRGGMRVNGGKWGQGDWGYSADQDGKCRKFQTGRKMGETRGKWDGNGRKCNAIAIFHSPMFPIVLEVEDLPRSSLCKNYVTALTRKWEIIPLSNTHRNRG